MFVIGTGTCGRPAAQPWGIGIGADAGERRAGRATEAVGVSGAEHPLTVEKSPIFFKLHLQNVSVMLTCLSIHLFKDHERGAGLRLEPHLGGTLPGGHTNCSPGSNFPPSYGNMH